METTVPFEEHKRKATRLFEDLIDNLGSKIPDDTKAIFYESIRAGELDDAIESILDLSGGSHLFVIPSSFAPRIEDWLTDFGTPGPDDDDYLWVAARRAIEYSQSHKSVAIENHTIPIHLPEPDYELVEKKAASFGTSPQELVTSWVKERIGDLAYA